VPIYEYICSKCETPQEQIRSMDERDEPDDCESCGARGKHLERQVSRCSFRLQPGLGWDGWDKDKTKPGFVTRELTGSKVPTEEG